MLLAAPSSLSLGSERSHTAPSVQMCFGSLVSTPSSGPRVPKEGEQQSENVQVHTLCFS